MSIEVLHETDGLLVVSDTTPALLWAEPWYENEAFLQQGWWAVRADAGLVAALPRKPSDSVLLAIATEML